MGPGSRGACHRARIARPVGLAGTTTFLFAAFFGADHFFFTADFLTFDVLALAFFAVFFVPLRALGRLRSAARWAAAKAAFAQLVNSSVSSNSRAGNSQYELTVTTFAVDLC